MTIEKFAEKFRLRVTTDECGGKIIEGFRGHLYFDNRDLCLMSLDARFVKFNTPELQMLGGKLWEGTTFRDSKGRRTRDVIVKRIPEEKLETRCDYYQSAQIGGNLRSPERETA